MSAVKEIHLLFMNLMFIILFLYFHYIGIHFQTMFYMAFHILKHINLKHRLILHEMTICFSLNILFWNLSMLISEIYSWGYANLFWLLNSMPLSEYTMFYLLIPLLISFAFIIEVAKHFCICLFVYMYDNCLIHLELVLLDH